MNSIGEGVLTGINNAIDTCEKEFKGLVISNEADYFSAGADLGTLFMLAGNKDFKKIEESELIYKKYFNNNTFYGRKCRPEFMELRTRLNPVRHEGSRSWTAMTILDQCYV